MSRKNYADDDGRVIANMNVEGMPDYSPHQPLSDSNGQELPPPTKAEMRSLMANAVLAALAIAGVFILAMFLFILFCTEVWFR